MYLRAQPRVQVVLHRGGLQAQVRDLCLDQSLAVGQLVQLAFDPAHHVRLQALGAQVVGLGQPRVRPLLLRDAVVGG